MTTPIILLALLTVPWLAGRLLGRDLGHWGPVAVFAFTGVGHFVATEPMIEMLPAFLPARRAAVLLSGAYELALAAALAWPATRRAAGQVAVVTLILLTPLNVYAAVNAVGPGGHTWGPVYLLIRLPLQAILIAGCYSWAVRRRNGGPR